ncbi:MAG: glycosyltransferase family 39 protein [Pirellulales bacterium]
MTSAVLVERPADTPATAGGAAARRAPRVATQWLCVGGVTLLALAVRLVHIGSQSFSMDEISELTIAHGSLREILWTGDGFPPLYHFLLHGWLKLWGTDAAARLLSAIFGAATIPVVWLIGRQLGGFRGAVASSLVLALLPLHVYYCQEARAYPLYTLLAATALWLFFRAVETDQRRDWIPYVLACALGMYTHYYFASVVGLAGVLLLLERRTWPRLRRGLAANAALVTVCLPLAWLLESDLALQTGYFAKAKFGLAEFAFTYFSMFTGFTLGPSLRDMHVMSNGQIVRALLPWGATLGAAVGVLGLGGLLALSMRWRIRLILLAVGSVLLLGGVGMLADLGYIVRYSVWAAIPVVLILAQGLATMRPRVLALGCGALLGGAFATAIYNHGYHATYATEDSRHLAEYLQASPDRRLPVVVSSGYMTHAVVYYLGDAWTAVHLPNRIDDEPSLAEADELIERHVRPGQPFWLVYTREFHGDPRGKFLDAARASYGVSEPAARFAGITLYGGQRAP